MKSTIEHGLVLGLLVGGWTLVMGYTGWYKHPTLLNLFWVVVLIQIGVLVSALRSGASSGNGYGAQVGRGVALSAVGGVLIIGSSLLFTTVLFPNYFEELRQIHVRMLRESGMSEEKVAETLAAAASMETPMIYALQGFVGTLMTGLVVSLVLAVFLRRKAATASGS